MRVLLISTYDLGRQPFGLASPAAWLRRAGVDVDCVDTSRSALTDEAIRRAGLVGFYLPMHTATRLAAPVLERVATVNPAAAVVAYGLYASLNAAWLRERGVGTVLGPEAEEELVRLAGNAANGAIPGSATGGRLPKLQFIQPDRSTLPALPRYAALQMPDGSLRIAGSTEATRGCKHLCRHCPIVPVYRGAFRAIPADVVLADIRAQVAAGAGHISFGDPDFLNGPTHARRIVERLASECPGVTYDVTIKVEHLLRHADMLPLLRDTGCLFVTSAVESIDPHVLSSLRKGHTPEDFTKAVALCRDAGVRLSPTFVPFTPWTTAAGYVELLDRLHDLELQDDVAPIQLAIRLLVTADSALLDLEDIRTTIEEFDAASLTYPWRHRDPAVDLLQQRVMALVSSMRSAARRETFAAIDSLARDVVRLPRRTGVFVAAPTPPHMTEAWYCCAEPGPDIANYL